MTLRMADGPVANLPPGLDAYAGYVVASGIGETWTEVQQIPATYHLSISARYPGHPAMCGDVEPGALSSWAGYTVGYTNLANVTNQILIDGRPEKLWVAHYTNVPHICSELVCDPFHKYGAGNVGGYTGWVADGTQWTTHNNTWDESLLNDDFFSFQNPSPTPTPNQSEVDMFVAQATSDSTHDPNIKAGLRYVITGTHITPVATTDDFTALVDTLGPLVYLSGNQIWGFSLPATGTP